MQTHTGTGLIHPERLLDRVGILPGHAVADIGCGSLGHMTFPLARRVGADGRVFAIDLMRHALEMVRRRAEREYLFNVETVWGDAERHGGTRLEDGIVDAAFVMNTLSAVRDPAIFADELARIIRPQGIIVLADWRHAETPVGPPLDARVSDETARSWFTGGAFEPEDAFSAGPYHYGMVLRRI